MAHYDKNQPFYASLKEKKGLTKPGSEKQTLHLALCLKNSGIKYRVGDSVAVFPQNDPEVVKNTLNALNADASTIVNYKRTGQAYPLDQFLSRIVNICKIGKPLFTAVLNSYHNDQVKEQLQLLLNQPDQLAHYLAQHELWDFLSAHPDYDLTLEEICNLLPPLLPRFYSIASSQEHVDDEIHLTVGMVEYETNGKKRFGVASQFLGCNVPLNEAVIPLYIQPTAHFTIPDDHTKPIIMIGPGTGIAPFRGFMQERLKKGASGKHWLFFGERNRATDFLYEEYWNELMDLGHLKVSAAFSRDQSHKIYVQHLMHQEGAEFWNWLQEGAYLYVCGDAHRMAKDVETTLLQIAMEHGSMAEDGARAFIKKLRQDKRYLRDVY
ncbi:MAG: sulfite reductase [Parachlamydiales bacterium]|nr:sulfite reductase [Parachlamydiales bacterium]